MNWRGEDLVTYGDIMAAVGLIAEAEDQKAADEFMAAYLLETSHARTNIGYLTGYFDEEMRLRICRLFDVVHPIFGTRTPTMEEAFEAGKQWGEQMGLRRKDEITPWATPAQLARVILYLAEKAAGPPAGAFPDDVADCLAWAAHAARKDGGF